MATFELDDFGAGIYRGRKAPAGSAFDLINALIDDEGQPFLRGKTANYGSSLGKNGAFRLFVVYAPAAGAERVLVGIGTDSYVLDGSLAPVKIVVGASFYGRFASVGDYLMSIDLSNNLTAYAGSRKVPAGSGTVTVTNGSTAVTGSGTSWLTDADAGMFLVDGSGAFAVIESVGGNTAMTLRAPWPGSTATTAIYSLESVLFPTVTLPTGFRFVAAAGSGTPRLLLAVGNRVYFTPPGDPFTFDANSYHELPANASITGIEGMGDAALVFTNRGVWRISNLSFDPVDDDGNVQHIVERINADIVLWDDDGIAVWDQGLVVPARDDVYLFSLDGAVRPISEGIRPLYRAYAKAGYRPGLSAVHRGHLLLPFDTGSAFVDALICRLDRPYHTPSGRVFFPWTRWAGDAGSRAYATLGSTLLGLRTSRVTDLTNCMDRTGAATQDADTLTPTFTVETNDVDTGPGIRPNTVEKVRGIYETAGGTPVITMHTAVGAEGSTYTAATLKRGGGASDGTGYSAWRVVRKAERIRFRFQSASAVESLILRRLEVTVRPSGQT